MAAPVAARRDLVHHEHGVERPDPWGWLRDRDDPGVLAHLQAENAHTEAATAPLEPLRAALYAEILGRIQEDDTTVPWPRGAWEYYTRTETGRPYTVHCRRLRGSIGPEHVVLDENALAEGSEYFHLGAMAVSPGGDLVAWAEDTAGSEQYVIRFRDLTTGADLPDRIEGTKDSLAWANDARTLFYTVPDEADRPWRILRHTLGSTDDVVVLEEPDALYYVDVWRTRDGRFVVADLESKITSEAHVIPADAPGEPFRVVRPREQGVEYTLDHGDGRFFLVINDAGAVNFRVISVRDDGGGDLRTEVAHDPEVYVTDVDVFARHLVVWERRDGLRGIRVIDRASGDAHQVAFDDAVYEVQTGRNAEYEASTLRFSYQSPITPPSTVSYDLDTRERHVLRRQPVPGYDATRYRTERVWATAPDGTRVPVSLAFRIDNGDGVAGPPRDGSAPLLLAGYGSYGLAYPDAFRNAWISLLDRGVVCGVAHVRGGSELGRPWYDAGKLEHKVNTFTDFAAAVDHLVATGWTSHDRVGIQGGSAGGLLMGWVINERPDLCAAVLALVPFVDLVTTMLDESLPLTVTEYEEWGDPRERGAFDRMLGYSPYDNVRPGPSPRLFATAGLNDPRVGYWEPAKWVQRLREAHPDAEVLLRVNLGAGHSGASGRYGQIEEAAIEYAWLLDRIGAAAGP